MGGYKMAASLFLLEGWCSSDDQAGFVWFGFCSGKTFVHVRGLRKKLWNILLKKGLNCNSLDMFVSFNFEK